MSGSKANFLRRGSRPLLGFTLVELLVVTCVLGILTAVTLPAVQSARESSRRCECKNNLKQLALACLSHHDVHGHFPTGGWGWYWTGDADRGFGSDQPGGWIFNTLPYFEQYDLYDLASDGEPDRLTVPQRRGAAQIVRTPLSIINCPTRRANRLFPMTANEGGADGFFNSNTPSQAGRSDYAINSGHMFNEWPFLVLGKGPRSYQEAAAWTAGKYWGVDQAPFNFRSPGPQVMSGISYERSIVPMRQITRGMSNTYLVGERYVPQAQYETGFDKGDNETWCTGFNNDNFRKTGRWRDGEIVECVPIPDAVDKVPQDEWGRFGSAHHSAWNVSFCDGSVRETSYEIHWQVHRDAGSRFSDTSY